MNRITEIAEALNFFGLNENYTEEELKKVYHASAKLYHPDKNGLEEKMKLLNHYYEILRKNLGNKNYENLLQFETEKNNYVIKFQDCCNNSFLSQDEILDYINKFDNEIKDFKTIDEIKQCYRKYIRIIYEKYIFKINTVLNQTLQFSANDYQLDYQAFYQLLHKKIIDFLIKKIDEIVSKYKLCHGYPILEKLILKESNSRKEDFENTEKYPHLFKRKIYEIDVLISCEKSLEKLDKTIKKIFKIYNEYIKNLNDLLNNIEDEDLKDNIREFIISFNNDVDFDEAKEFIIETILEYKERNSINNQKYILEELKEDILNKCKSVKKDDCIMLYLKKKLVGVYYPKTDTMNILLKTPNRVVWNHYNLSWFVFSTKFNIMDNGMYQQATAAWVIGIGAFSPYDLQANNMLLEHPNNTQIDEESTNISYLGYCRERGYNRVKPDNYGNVKKNLIIDILNYTIQFEYRINKHITINSNSYMAILDKHGKLQPDNGQFYEYLRTKKEHDYMDIRNAKSKNYTDTVDMTISKELEDTIDLDGEISRIKRH